LTVGFKDHFSQRSDNYGQYRPTYPDKLFQFLASEVANDEIAWDCGTGNGQAATALADYFRKVVASDASQSQIAAAVPDPRVDYRVASAEESGLASGSVDLVTVGQAFHWFDRSLFMAEAQRVLKPAGVLAIWCYELCNVNEECDAIVDTLYRDIVGKHWPPERIMIEQAYSDVEMPGETIQAPELRMTLEWRAAEMLGYLRTWSACLRFEQENKRDPVDEIAANLSEAWGNESRQVFWPLHIKASRANTLVE
jgi:SAM-dependent methyltransferase